MKPHLDRLLSKPKPRAAVPTKIRRIRRLFVNIEANGCPKYSCSTIRPRVLVKPSYDPWAVAKCQQMETNSAVYAYALNSLCTGTDSHWNECGLARPSAGASEPENMNELRLLLDNLNELQNGQQGNSFYQPRENLASQSCLTADQAQPTYSMGSLPNYSQQFSERNMNCEADIRKAELNTLTDMLQQTMAKLDSLVSLQTEKQAQVPPQLDMSYMPQLGKLLDNGSPLSLLSKAPKSTRAKRLVKVMPVQPLVIMPAAVANQATATPTVAPAAPVTPVAPAKVPYTKYRTRLRKKRYKAAGTNTSADSSANLMSSSQIAESASQVKDSGTTMWCPRSCCKHCCGIVTDSATSMSESTLKTQQSEAKDMSMTPLSSPIQLTMPQGSFLGVSPQLSLLHAGNHTEGYQQSSSMHPGRHNEQNRYSNELPLSTLLRDGNYTAGKYTGGSPQTIFIAPGSYELPPPKSMLKNQGSYYEPSSGHGYGAHHQQMPVATEMSDQYPTSHDMDYEYTYNSQAPEKERSRAGKLSYSYTEEEEEEQLRAGSDSDAEQSCGDEWYHKVCHSLAELEEEQSYFSNMNTPQCTCDKGQQTDCLSTHQNTDKCICTNDLEAAVNPRKIVPRCRPSSLKCRRRKPLARPQSQVKSVSLPKTQTKIQTQSNPFPLEMGQSLPKYRVLKSMSEALPVAAQKHKKRRVYTCKQLARYQKLLALVESTEEAYARIYRELKGNPMNRSIPFHRKRATGATTYPTNWPQLGNSVKQHALLE
ncbi:PREDICTED: uncharacterized protein LOC108610284 [Drosophila arizonae]|uniref:Uncharacterized protein LOC108610284 n=1 Tax=Drosophila arizonae TaxID=7263 RepID=A0ABM1NS38_DROAR|nr:PREDICTED: uncharacterized protein LOC108610284 [Drosophila arizonae]